MDRGRLKEDLKRDEGERLIAYLCSEGIWTIGVGHTGGVRPGMVISEYEQEQLLEQDIDEVVADLDRKYPWWREMTEARQRALANMAFNLGISRLSKFRRMMTALTLGNYELAAQEALDSKWAKQVGARAHRLAKMFKEG